MSKKENVRFLPPVKRYVNAVEHRLHLPLREKARVMSDISTSIAARHEAGESYEAIMADMGTPEAVAQPFNQAFAGQYKGAGPGRLGDHGRCADFHRRHGPRHGNGVSAAGFPLGRRLFRRHHWRGRRPHRSVCHIVYGHLFYGAAGCTGDGRGPAVFLLFMPGSGHPRRKASSHCARPGRHLCGSVLRALFPCRGHAFSGRGLPCQPGRDVFISRVPAHSHSPGPGDLAHAAKAGKRNGGRKP